MVNNRVLADTCAWVDFFRARTTPLGDAFEHILLHGELFTCGVIVCELIQGARSQNDKQMLLDAMQPINSISIPDPLWVKAGELSSSLRKKGITIPLSDIIIATVALNNDLAVLTIDRHFDQVPGLKVINKLP